MKNKFNFNRSFPIVKALTGQNGDIAFDCPGIWSFIGFRACHLNFVVSKKLEKNTGSPCLDLESQTIGFPDKDTMDYFMRKWQLIKPSQVAA